MKHGGKFAIVKLRLLWAFNIFFHYAVICPSKLCVSYHSGQGMIQVVIPEHGHSGLLLCTIPNHFILKDTLALSRPHELLCTICYSVDERDEA